MNDDDDDDDNNAAIVTPSQSTEHYEDFWALEKLWNGTWTAAEWAEFATMEVPLGNIASSGMAAANHLAPGQEPQEGLLRFSTMMVQDIQNPEYMLLPPELRSSTFSSSSNNNNNHNNDATWLERTPIYLVPYPNPWVTTRQQQQLELLEEERTLPHRDKRPRYEDDPSEKRNIHQILAHFYFDQYPILPTTSQPERRLQINELIDIVAIRGSSISTMGKNHNTTSMIRDDTNHMEDNVSDGTYFDSMMEDDPVNYYNNSNNNNDDGQYYGGWHVLWYRRRCMYDGIMMMASTSSMTPPILSLQQQQQPQPPNFANSSLAYQALMLLLYSRTERTKTGHPMMTPNNDQLLGCATLRWIVQDPIQRDALLLALPTPYTILHSTQLTSAADEPFLIPRRDPHTNRLRLSPFQLPAGALLVLDLTDDALFHHNTTTISAVVQQVLQTRRLDYCFDGGVKIPFETDYRILVITNPNLRSCNYFLSPESTFTIETSSSELMLLNPIQTTLPRLAERVELPQVLLESVVQAYTSLPSGQKSEARLHRWLIATRSIARYHSRSTATIADFEMAYQVESKLQ